MSNFDLKESKSDPDRGRSTKSGRPKPLQARHTTGVPITDARARAGMEQRKKDLLWL